MREINPIGELKKPLFHSFPTEFAFITVELLAFYIDVFKSVGWGIESEDDLHKTLLALNAVGMIELKFNEDDGKILQIKRGTIEYNA